MAVLDVGDVPEVSALKELDKLRARARNGDADRAVRILDRAPHRKPDPGDDLAVVDGGVTIKVAERRDGRVWLMPRAAGRGFEPILVTETTEIWGVVAGVARRYPVD